MTKYQDDNINLKIIKSFGAKIDAEFNRFNRFKQEFIKELKLLFSHEVEFLDKVELNKRCLGCDDVKEFIDEYGISELECNGLVNENLQCNFCHGSGKAYLTLYSIFSDAQEKAGIEWKNDGVKLSIDIKKIVCYINMEDLLLFVKNKD